MFFQARPSRAPRVEKRTRHSGRAEIMPSTTTDDPSAAGPAAPGPASVSSAPASPARDADPRLRLQADRSGLSLLDGGWWPRSADLAAELPGLLPALDERHGRITRVMLGTADWNASRPRRLVVSGPKGNRVVKLGWFDTMPDGLLTAIAVSGDRTDLVTIPADTGEQAAVAAMQQASKDGNREHAPAILAGLKTAAAGGVAAS
jgi:hypothetical protein